MIGMPRITFTRLAATHPSTRLPETRMNAQTIPSPVDSTSAPAVTSTVSHKPSARIGRNSWASARNPLSSHGQARLSPPHRYSRPHFARIFATPPSAFSFASAVSSFARIGSPLRNPIATDPVMTAL